jgi:hypothetical protein
MITRTSHLDPYRHSPRKLACEEPFCPLRKIKKREEEAGNLDGSLNISCKAKCNTTLHTTSGNIYVFEKGL